MEPSDDAAHLRRKLGAEVARRRAEMDWSQAQLAREVGLDVGTISRIERGVRGTSDQTLIAIAHALDVEVRDLFASLPTTTEAAS